MVDALEMTRTDSEETEIVVEAASPDARRRYREFAGQRVKGAAQHPLWFETWLDQSGETGHVVWLRRDGEAVAALPLVETRISGLPALSFPGGAHANGNFCATIDPDAAIPFATLSTAIRRTLPHIAMVSLERQHRMLGGQTNIMAGLATRSSPNIALAASLEGGFAGVLERAHGKKKSKKRRAQVRRFEEAGGSALHLPATGSGIDDFLDAYFRMKKARFDKAGLPDVFAPPHVRAFWRALLSASQAEGDRPFTLEALVVGGSVRAITGSSHLADRTVCEFGAIEDDELTSISPGEYLAFSNIEAACAKDLTIFDFSVGDEAYKRSWCDVEITHFDVVIPLTPAARIAVLGSNLVARAKQTIKSNPQLWSVAKAVRRLK